MLYIIIINERRDDMKFYTYNADFSDGKKMTMETGAKITEAKRSMAFEAASRGTKLMKFVKVSERNL